MKKHLIATIAHFACFLSLGCPALAAEEPVEAASEEDAQEEDGQKMNLSVAPPSDPVQRTDYLHEGFYFRFSLGPGIMSTTSKAKGVNDSFNDTGFSLGTELLVGGSPAPGLTIGGGALTDMNFAGSGPGLNLLAGPFFDAFPDNKGGWHLGGLVGFDMLAGDGDPLFGGGGGAWVGHDIWVAPEWSTGFNLRLAGSRVGNSNLGATNFSLHFLITVLNH
jgi:hypothetical protein